MKKGRQKSRTKESITELLQEASALLVRGNRKEAEASYRRATQVDPNCIEAWDRLGRMMEDELRIPEAAFFLARRLQVSESQVAKQTIEMAWDIARGKHSGKEQFQLGCVYWNLRQFDRARLHLGNALRNDPSLSAEVHALYGTIHLAEGRYPEAIEEANIAIEADPANYNALRVLAQAYINLGQPWKAVPRLRQANALKPSPSLHSSLVFYLNFLPEATPQMIYDEARRWNEMHAAPLASQIPPHTNFPNPDRRLRIGYLSPDLYKHAIMKFLPPVFERHDRSRFEVFVYAVGDKSDPQIGSRLERYATLPGEPEEIADRIRADGIDILVDLAGHTDWRTMLVLARKPAPVQVTWLGATFTTGLSTMDYYLGDGYIPAPGTEPFFSETVYRMPKGCCCFRPFLMDVPLAPSPCLQRGFITFGSFHNPGKINRDVVKVWSTILHLVPNSRLLLKYAGMETGIVQERYRKWFTAEGIAGDRLTFAGMSQEREYMDAYGEIDIALDPFPFNGGSTTLDTAWMGVPIVTMSGKLTVQRQTGCVLSAMGVGDTIAETPEQYVRAALFLAELVACTPNLRNNVRQAFRFSHFLDEFGMVKQLEVVYRDMWRTWCRRQNPDSLPSSVGISTEVQQVPCLQS